MRHLYIIGDSNAKYLVDPISEHKYFHDIPMGDITVHIRSFRSKTAYQVDSSLLDSIEFEDDSVVLFYFGMIDIRSYSTRYKNTEEVALKYIYTVKQYFKDKNIKFGFIEPIPSPHIDDWTNVFPELYNWVSGSVEERLLEHNKFVSVISLEDLFIPVIGPVLKSYHMTTEHTDDFNHLNIKHNNLLLDYILLNIKNL